MIQTDGIFNEVVVARHLCFINWLKEWPGTCMSLDINKHQVAAFIIPFTGKELQILQRYGTKHSLLLKTHYYKLLLQNQCIIVNSSRYATFSLSFYGNQQKYLNN